MVYGFAGAGGLLLKEAAKAGYVSAETWVEEDTAKIEPRRKAEPDSRTEPHSRLEPDLRVDPETSADPAARTDSGVRTEPDAWTDSDAPTNRDIGTDPEAPAALAGQPDLAARADLDARTDSDAWSDPDALEELGDRIATLAAHIHAADYRLLVMIEEFDRRRGFEPGGHRSCAEWLHFRTGLDRNTAREKVRAARALVCLPETSAAMSRGELSFAKVRAVTRAATSDTEAELVAFARSATVAETERFVRAWRKLDRLDEEALERERHRSRRLSIRPDEGMYVIRGRLEPEVGALLMRAIELADDALYRTTARSEELEPTQRRADAIGLIAERVMAVGFGAEDVSAETWEEDGEGGRSHLEDGTRVSAETARRLTCDSAVVRIRRGPDGSVLDVGRRTRSIPPAIRRALEVRDGGCRFPGCGLRFTSGHHIVHWADGGATSLENLVLLCRFHHRLIHQEGFGVAWGDLTDRPAFRDPRGRTIPDWPPPERLPGDPAETLVRAHMKADIDPHALTASSRWKSQPDIPWVAYVRVLEALDREEA